MYLTKGMFQENLNTRFSLIAEGLQPCAVDLVEVADGYSTPKQEQFSLRFRGDRANIYPQRIYAVKHDSIGEFELFLVPVGRDDSGTFYEAVFNRFINHEPVHREPVKQNQEKDQQRAS
jgi:hypothetical protein